MNINITLARDIIIRKSSLDSLALHANRNGIFNMINLCNFVKDICKIYL